MDFDGEAQLAEHHPQEMDVPDFDMEAPLLADPFPDMAELGVEQQLPPEDDVLPQAANLGLEPEPLHLDPPFHLPPFPMEILNANPVNAVGNQEQEPHIAAGKINFRLLL